ncbi:MAG TPA: tRNA (adenosine(37)-N6)-threonylcarbamoyltransferase complex ATPase subunit type 1 TsaE [Candidatus Paceibacterota bacterium]
MTHVPLKELPEFVRNAMAVLALNRDNTKAVVVTLKGELGSGKTTFVQTLARELGVTDSVQSPTYVLMKIYRLPEGLNRIGQPRRFKKLVHIDAYRLEKPEQFAALKPEEFLHDPEVLVCIEWPERVEAVLPKPDLGINFSSEKMEEGERSIEIKK